MTRRHAESVSLHQFTRLSLCSWISQPRHTPILCLTFCLALALLPPSATPWQHLRGRLSLPCLWPVSTSADSTPHPHPSILDDSLNVVSFSAFSADLFVLCYSKFHFFLYFFIFFKLTKCRCSPLVWHGDMHCLCLNGFLHLKVLVWHKKRKINSRPTFVSLVIIELFVQR